MRRVSLLVLLLCPLLAAGGWADEPARAGLSLGELPGLVIGHDATAAVSAQTTLAALHAYKGTVAQALPQIDFSTSYSLAFMPSDESSSYTFLTSAPFVENFDDVIKDEGTHLVAAKLSLSQLLPTAGSLALSLEDTMTMSTIGSLSVNDADPTTPDATYSQKPKLSLSLSQPLFVNGKLFDLDIFPSTLRKAELGYLEQSASDLNQRNQTIGQAVQLYLSIVQLRKAVAQSNRSIEVSQGNLDSLQKSYALGSVAEPDLLDSKVALSRQKQSLLELSSTLAKTEWQLAHSIGRDDLAGAPLSDAVPDLPFTMDRQQIIDAALSGHPLLRQKSLAAEEKRVDAVLNGEQYASTLSLSFSWAPTYPYDSGNNPYTTTDLGASFTDLFGSGGRQNYTLAAGLTIHLFDGGKGSEAAATSAAVAAASASGLEAQRQAVRDQVELDLLQKASLEEKITLLADASSLADRRRDMEKSLLALGKSTDLDVASREADAEATANELWRARADLYLVILDLYSLAGEDLAKLVEGSKQ